MFANNVNCSIILSMLNKMNFYKQEKQDKKLFSVTVAKDNFKGMQKNR